MHTKLATIALAAAAAAAPLAASAQSSVTVYGLLDMYLQYGKGDGTQTQIQSGGPQARAWASRAPKTWAVA
ncbi:porin [uncultured Aquabacterium sp.]|uniref:porin n=1 Tax=Aquabacterium sp. TaxID=1872578 RepID=UPI0025CEA142|nr:porin [uncultured Aquabacterium sp.]